MTRQPAYVGSTRARRGALLRLLAATNGNGLPPEITRRQLRLDRATFRAMLVGLERDGLVHRSGARLRLGGVPTIGR